MGSGSERANWPSVAVIIPVYNDASRLVMCLKALERQTYPTGNYEVVVVDNGSIDDIAQVCDSFRQARCLCEPRPGSYAARNKGIVCTTAEILAFTDSDCIPHEDWLENGVRRLVEDPDCGILGGDVIVFPKDDSRISAAELYESAFAFPQKQRIAKSHWSVTANLFARRSLIEAIGPFNGELRSGGDKEWGLRAFSAGHETLFAEEARVDHPARSSIGEILAKARRIGGGKHMLMLDHDASNRYLIRYLVRSVYYSFRNTCRVVRGGTVNYADLRRFTLLERLKIAFVHTLFGTCRLTEIVILRLTRGPARRT